MGAKKKLNISVGKMLKVYKQVFALTKKYKKQFIVALFLLIGTQVLQLSGEYFFSRIIDALISMSGAELWDSLVVLIALYAGSYMIVSVFQYFNTLLISYAHIMLDHDLELKIYEKLVRLSLSYHESENTGSKLEKLSRGTSNVRRLIENTFWEFLPTIFRILISFIFLVVIDYRLGLIYLVVIPFHLFFTFKMNYDVYPLHMRVRKGFENVYGRFGQAIYNVKTVKAYVQEENEINTAKKGILRIIKDQLKIERKVALYNYIRWNLVTLGGVLVVISGAYLTSIGEITPGQLVLFLSLAIQTYYALFGLSRLIDNIVRSQAAVERIFEILDEPERVPLSANPVDLAVKGEIMLKNVSFSYNKTRVLKNINLTINPGEVVAVVGPSGGGKTTFAKLIYRYFDVSSGTLMIDGEDIRDLDLNSYRRQLGLVSQHIDIFNDSVMQNIAYGKPKAAVPDIKSAAKLANAHGFIMKLENNYKTIVGEQGVKLSGGQKQRIGIARAILVDPKILILDEATSSLDAEAEHLIQKAIQKVIQKRTTIIIAHRLSTIKQADRIIVIDSGRIVEQGTHAELLKSKGSYAKLVALQIKGYID